MPLDEAEVRRVARLAHLEFPRVRDANGRFAEPPDSLIDAAALEKLAGDFARILEHVALLEEVDVDGVPPTSHGIPLATLFRSDTPGPAISPDDALEGAPSRVGDAFAVPKIVE